MERYSSGITYIFMDLSKSYQTFIYIVAVHIKFSNVGNRTRA